MNLLRDGALQPTGLQVTPEPIFSEHDFTSFDLEHGRFTVTAAAARRFSETLSAAPVVRFKFHKELDLESIPDQAFLMMSHGSPICVGVFSTRLSSSKYAAPTIKSERASFQGDDDVGFSFQMPLPPGAKIPQEVHWDKLRESIQELRLNGKGSKISSK